MQSLGELWRTRVRGTERARVVSDALGTLVVGVALLAVGLQNLWPQSPDSPYSAAWWHAIPLVAICAIMLGKRRRPVAALVAGTVVFGLDLLIGGSIGVLLGLFDLIYTAAVRAGHVAVRRLRTVTGAVVVMTFAGWVVATGDLRTAVHLTLLVFGLVATPMWWGLNVRQQAELAALATARAEDAQRLADLRRAEAVREERTTMARDLHDALAGNLSAIAINAEAALALPEGAPRAEATARTALGTIRTASLSAMEEMRAMILLLRSAPQRTGGSGAGSSGAGSSGAGSSGAYSSRAGTPRPDGAGTSSSATAPARLSQLGTLVTAARASGLTVRLDVPPAPPELPSAVDQAAYRIVQEALTNAVKHSPGGSTEVEVTADRRQLRLAVVTAPATWPALTPSGGAGTTPPPPRPSPPGSGLGLVTMRERTEVLGGTFAAGPETDDDGGERWAVRATLPLLLENT